MSCLSNQLVRITLLIVATELSGKVRLRACSKQELAGRVRMSNSSLKTVELALLLDNDHMSYPLVFKQNISYTLAHSILFAVFSFPSLVPSLFLTSSKHWNYSLALERPNTQSYCRQPSTCLRTQLQLQDLIYDEISILLIDLHHDAFCEIASFYELITFQQLY